ncbi:MAG: helix-hairpin-helix domain-containing protein, partial [Bilophila sp.]
RAYTLEGDTACNGDDYAALAAWMRRRLASGPPWADLVLIDGGRGQVSAVQRVLYEEGATGHFLLAGIAKARDENGKTDRRAGNVSDRIFLPGRSNPLPLRDGSAELLFLQHVRDTAHHFVLGRHRKARGEAALSGELLRIPGVGKATAQLLWDHFKTLEEMVSATPENLAAIPGIGPRKATLLAERLKAMGTRETQHPQNIAST